MRDFLKNTYKLNVTGLAPLQRQDAGHGNQLWHAQAGERDFFLKEIPEHSKSGDLEGIYRALSWARPKGYRMVLPILSKNQRYLEAFEGRSYMLYPFVEHTTLMDARPSMKGMFGLIEKHFACMARLQLPEHPFKTYQNWFERAGAKLEEKVGAHPFLDAFGSFCQDRWPELHFVNGPVHFDLNPYNMWFSPEHELLLSDFDNAQTAAYAKDVFDSMSIYLNVNLPETNWREVKNFARNWVRDITDEDTRFLGVRPKLGELFSPSSPLSKEEIRAQLQVFLEFCRG